jgi:TRAP-type mannitol/chloroaromatic compound transport system permease small subunit
MTSEKIPRPAVCQALDAFIVKIGLAVSWANVVLIIAIITNVFMRYGLGQGQVWLEELQWHLWGFAAMMGLAYSHVLDSPIRVDIIYQKFSSRVKAKWDIFGTFVFLLPWIFVVVEQGILFWMESWGVNERSDSPLGLPFRWIIKSIIPISYTLLGIAAISRLISNIALLAGSRRAKHGS